MRQYIIKSHNVWNMDEKGFLLCLTKACKVIVNARQKHRFLTQDGSRETITALEGVGASGRLIPPMLIFKGTQQQYG